MGCFSAPGCQVIPKKLVILSRFASGWYLGLLLASNLLDGIGAFVKRFEDWVVGCTTIAARELPDWLIAANTVLPARLWD